MRTRLLCLTLLPLCLAATRPIAAQDKSYLPTVAAASNEPDRARQLIRRPNDVDVTLFAAEPQLANPVAFGTDEKGRFYVVETFRLKAGVTDNRSHMYWLDDDMAAKTVADRIAMTKKWLKTEAATYAVEHDRIRLIEDRDGDGKADADTVFASGFNQIESGLASGVLARKGDVYFACIPDLWLLRDTNGDGKADTRTVLSSGYGVHVAFLGHDLHGLIVGPDGRLYFSIGDRGLHVVTKDGKVVSNPDSGAVLRCNLDGSNLEVFATGLRNPQELAFDNYGNLFTVDNNSDSGDRARVVYLIEGGDSGWRMGYQYLEKPNSRGPWNAEKLWYPRPENTGAYLNAPLMNLSDGPSGLTFDPGVTLLPARYKDHFFLADFRGGFAQSGIRSFALEANGASFKVIDSTEPFWSLLATDVDFGPDGALYVSDWVDGWDKTGKGRLWRFADPSRKGDPAVLEVKKLLAEGMAGRKPEELRTLLGHADRRVRTAAGQEMADQTIKTLVELQSKAGEKVLDPSPDLLGPYFILRDVSATDERVLARLHAVWALAQISRKFPSYGSDLLAVKGDASPEVRAQVAVALGEAPHLGTAEEARKWLTSSLKDASPRVRFLAAQALGKIGTKADIAALVELLKSNADHDPNVRFGAVFALARIGDAQALVALAKDASSSVRLGAVLALRRFAVDDLAPFLADTDARIRLEAARAIYDDQPVVNDTMKALASLANVKGLDASTLRRVINANARVGTAEAASRLVALARRSDVPTSIRVEALELLGDWAKPSGRDRISGLWKPFAARSREVAADAFAPAFDELAAPTSDTAVRRAAIAAVGGLDIDSLAGKLLALVSDNKLGGLTRVEALRSLEKLDDPTLADAVTSALSSTETALKAEALKLVPKTDPGRAIPILSRVLKSGSTSEKQSILGVLAAMAKPEADALLLSHLKANDLPPEAELDLLNAAESRRSDKALAAALNARLDKAKSAGGPLAATPGLLLGGNAENGKAIFESNAAVYCIRCHKIGGQGGEVGPDLTGVGARKTRDYLATAIVAPNHEIAQGFETVVVALADGKVISGVLKSENEKTLNLMSVENKPIVIPKSEIEERKRGPSAMPEDVAKKLKNTEIRDLVEFLATRK